jgi:photosystem II PsbU protein
MKRYFRWLSLVGVILLSSLCIGFGWSTSALPATAANASIRPCVETGKSIDLNNANLIAFTDCPGFYPTLTQVIVSNSPYKRVEDVLKIANLTEQQEQLLKANLNHFTVSEATTSLEQRMPPRPAMKK